MQVQLDTDAIAAAINNSATKALSKAFDGYSMQTAVAEIVTDEVVKGAIADSIKLAVQGLDRAALANALAQELQKAVTKAVVTMLNEGLVDIVCKLRGIGQYGEDVKRREAIKAELTSR